MSKPVPMEWSFANDIAICSVLPALWITSCFHTMGPVDQNLAQCFEEVCQVAVPVGCWTPTVFS